MDMNLSKLWEIVGDRKAWCVSVHGVAKSWTRLSNWKATTNKNRHKDTFNYCNKESDKSDSFFYVTADSFQALFPSDPHLGKLMKMAHHSLLWLWQDIQTTQDPNRVGELSSCTPIPNTIKLQASHLPCSLQTLLDLLGACPAHPKKPHDVSNKLFHVFLECVYDTISLNSKWKLGWRVYLSSVKWSQQIYTRRQFPYHVGETDSLLWKRVKFLSGRTCYRVMILGGAGILVKLSHSEYKGDILQ